MMLERFRSDASHRNAVLAVIAAGVSAYFAYSADRRAAEAELPIVEWDMSRPARRQFDVDLVIRNTTRIRADVSDALVTDPDGAVFEGGSMSAPEPVHFTPNGEHRAQIPIPLKIPSGETRTLRLRVVLPDQMAARDHVSFRIRLRIETGNSTRVMQSFVYTKVL